MRMEMKLGERHIEAEVSSTCDTATVTLDGRPLDLELLHHCRGELDLSHEGRRVRAFVAGAGDSRQVFLAGRVLTVQLPSSDDDEATDEASGGPNLVAEMPGKVVKLLVAEGKAVTAGEGLIILESMKMETELAATVAGTVARLHVEAGQTVAQGDALVDIEPAED